MKKILLVAALLMAGCTTSTAYGDCVGVLETKDDSLTYSYSITNLVIGFLFSETIIVPAVVIIDMLECPTGVK